MRSFNPLDLPVPQRHQMLLSAVAPRPIAFASTIDVNGNPNLAPFSFFNVFSSNPPTMIFSPAKGGRDGKLKDTLLNVQEHPEVVINVVSYAMVQQMSLASTAYPKGVNEFEKAGFTPLESEIVKPFRVAESPAQFECKVNQVVTLGDQGGAGNLVICEVLKMHFADHVFNEEDQIDPHKIDLVSRMGYNYYGRSSGDAVFELVKPIGKIGVGVDVLPEAIRNSKILTGNQLGILGNVETLPEVDRDLAAEWAGKSEEDLHQYLADQIDAGEVEKAWSLIQAL